MAEAARKGIGIVAMKTQAGGSARPDPKLATPLTQSSRPPCSSGFYIMNRSPRRSLVTPPTTSCSRTSPLLQILHTRPRNGIFSPTEVL